MIPPTGYGDGVIRRTDIGNFIVKTKKCLSNNGKKYEVVLLQKYGESDIHNLSLKETCYKIVALRYHAKFEKRARKEM